MISGALVVAPVIVAVAFFVSGVSKLRTPGETARAMRELKVPFPAVHPLAARVLPWAEVALALALLVLPSFGFRSAAWIAAATLLAFTAFLIAALARHDEVDCNCFGSLAPGGSVVTVWTVVRNSVLFALAAVSALFVPNGVIIQLSQLHLTELSWFVLLLSNAAALVAIALFAGRRRASAAATGVSLATSIDTGPQTAGPDTEFVSATGDIVPFRKLWQGRATVVFFIKTECAPCAEITNHLEEWRQAIAHSIDVRIVTSTSQAAFRQAYPDLADDALYSSLSTRDALGIAGHPAAVLLGRDGSITGPAQGSDDVVDFLTAIVTAVEDAATVPMD